MNDVQAVIFDADGTLLNSFELINSAYAHVATEHNLRIASAEEIRSHMGKSIPDIFRALYPDEDPAKLVDTNSTYVAANIMKSEAYEGVDDLLKHLIEAGLKLAILTSGGPKINEILKHHGWDKYFSSVIHHELVSNPKPDAEGFLMAAKECGIEPNTAIMVGDTVVDIQTGKNANALATVAISHGYGIREDLEQSKPDYLVDSILELKPILLRRAI